MIYSKKAQSRLIFVIEALVIAEENKNERSVPYLKQYDTYASHILIFLFENYQFSIMR